MCDCECKKACKMDRYLDTQNYPCKKCVFGKLALACEGEIQIKTET